MSAVVTFPLERWPPPADARPIGRVRHVFVYPEAGEWVCLVVDINGGYVAETDGTKWAAIEAGLDVVRNTNAVMTIGNSF